MRLNIAGKKFVVTAHLSDGTSKDFNGSNEALAYAVETGLQIKFTTSAHVHIITPESSQVDAMFVFQAIDADNVSDSDYPILAQVIPQAPFFATQRAINEADEQFQAFCDDHDSDDLDGHIPADQFCDDCSYLLECCRC